MRRHSTDQSRDSSRFSRQPQTVFSTIHRARDAAERRLHAARLPRLVSVVNRAASWSTDSGGLKPGRLFRPLLDAIFTTVYITYRLRHV
jgi:hypothetical protein